MLMSSANIRKFFSKTAFCSLRGKYAANRPRFEQNEKTRRRVDILFYYKPSYLIYKEVRQKSILVFFHRQKV